MLEDGYPTGTRLSTPDAYMYVHHVAAQIRASLTP